MHTAIHNDQQIRLLISQIVPKDALQHVQFCRLAGRILRVSVDNASWLSRMRFSASQLIDKLNENGMDVEQITWHVVPPRKVMPLRRKSLRKATSGSAKAAANIRASAADMRHDELRAALLKLAAHVDQD